jgi:methylmalonyl-CoA mutase N-terminal domain/subunit
MTSYFTKDYSAWKDQITKELRGSKSFEEFLNLEFLGQKLQRYYTLEEHTQLGDFPKKLSVTAKNAKASVFNNYLWLNEKTEAIKHFSDGSYNGLFLEKASDISNLDSNIDLGFVKTMVASGELTNVDQDKMSPKGDYPNTLIANYTDNSETNFSENGIYEGYAAAVKGAYIDTELALAIGHGIKAVRNGCKKINIVLGFGPDDWFHLNTKLRVLPYLWKSALAKHNLSCDSFAFTLKAIPTAFPKQDEYNHLLRQCMVAFAAISHGADGVVFAPYTDSHLGEHATGRVATIIANECFVNSPEDHYEGNYLLDFGSKILADAVWHKLLALGTNDTLLIQNWIEDDKSKWLSDDRKFIGLNAYLAEDNTNITPSFNSEGQKTFS